MPKDLQDGSDQLRADDGFDQGAIGVNSCRLMRKLIHIDQQQGRGGCQAGMTLDAPDGFQPIQLAGHRPIHQDQVKVLLWVGALQASQGGLR